jgi:hypothetical protein
MHRDSSIVTGTSVLVGTRGTWGSPFVYGALFTGG